MKKRLVLTLLGALACSDSGFAMQKGVEKGDGAGVTTPAKSEKRVGAGGGEC